jgi:hypothetical protein
MYTAFWSLYSIAYVVSDCFWMGISLSPERKDNMTKIIIIVCKSTDSDCFVA